MLRAQVKASRLCCLLLSILHMGEAVQILLGTRPFISFQRLICPEHTPLGRSGCPTPWLRAIGCLPGQGRRQDPCFSSAKPTRSRRQAADTPASCGQEPPVVMATGRAAASPAPLHCPAVGSCRHLSPHPLCRRNTPHHREQRGRSRRALNAAGGARRGPSPAAPQEPARGGRRRRRDSAAATTDVSPPWSSA